MIPATQEEAAERADLARCLDALEAACGQRPPGWISPRCTPSARTTALLAQAELAWHSDFFDADLPRMVQTGHGAIVAVPFTMEANDMPLSVRYGSEPEAYTRTFARILDGWGELPPRPACLDFTVHAHVYGRPMGAAAGGDRVRPLAGPGARARRRLPHGARRPGTPGGRPDRVARTAPQTRRIKGNTPMLTWYRELSRGEHNTFCGCFGGWALDAFDVQLYSFVLPAIVLSLGVSQAEAGLLGTSALIASAVGGWVGGVLADRHGRVRVLQWTVL